MKARFLALAALVLGLASCQNDPEIVNPVGGGEVDFQLAVSATELGTRANDGDLDGVYGHNSAYGAIDYLSDAEWANDVDLRYTLEVYDFDATGNYTDAKPIKDRQVKVVDEYASVAFDLRLVPNRKYHFVVFADFIKNGVAEDKTESITDQADLGLHHIIGETLGDITIKADAINNEHTDAYFATEDITITNSAAQDIILKRPYGKLRVVANDLAELNLNVNPKSVKVDYRTAVPTTFNALTGKVDTKVADKSFFAVLNVDKNNMSGHLYTEGYDAEKAPANAERVERYSHVTLFTDYILAEKEGQTPYQFTMTVYDDQAGKNQIKETHFNTDIPVQRNHLTTIIGNVLTTATEINVTINDNFDDDNIDRNFVLVNTAKELQEALDAYKNGQTILFDADIKAEDINILQKEGVNVIIDGNGYKFDGKFNVNGNARSAGQETLTFKNINFETNGSDFTFINAPSKVNGVYNYSHNVTIEKCSFKGNHTVGCASFTGTYNFVMKDCEADNVHSIAQFQSVDNTVLVENVKVTNSKSGLSFGNTAYPTLKHADIQAAEYGVRGDANASRGNLVIEDANIDAKFPVIIRKVTTAGYTVKLDGTTLEAPGYHVVFTAGDDGAKVFEAPTVEFKVDGADNYNVFPGDKKFAYNRESLKYFLKNTETGENTIELAANIEGNVRVDQKEGHNVVIVGHNYNYDGTISIDGHSRSAGLETVRIKDVNFVAADDKTIDFIEQDSTDGAIRYAHNVTIENCTFKGGENAVGMRFRQCFDIVIKDCEVKAGHSLAQMTGCATVAIEGTTVNSSRGVSFGTSTNCSVKNSTFNVESYGLRADGSVATSLNIENTTVNAAKPVIVRKNTADYQVHFTGVNELGTTGYQVVFTAGADDAAFVAPAHNPTVTGADSFVVFPRDAENNGIVYNATELDAALNNNNVTKIILQEGEYGTIVAKSNKIIIGTPNAKVDCVNLCGADNVTLQNIAFDARTAKRGYDYKNNAKQYANIISGDNVNKSIKGSHNVVIDGCTFTGTFSNGGAAIAFTDQSRPSGFSGNITIKNCKFETTGGYYDIYGHYCGNGQNGYGDFVIENNTFNTVFAQGGPVYLGRYASSTPVVVKNNAFSTVTSLDAAVYVQDHSNYGVSIDASGNTFAN